jgi:hypothetical protein
MSRFFNSAFCIDSLRAAAPIPSPLLDFAAGCCPRQPDSRSTDEQDYDYDHEQDSRVAANAPECLALSRFVSLSANSYHIPAKINHQILAQSAVKPNMPNVTVRHFA